MASDGSMMVAMATKAPTPLEPRLGEAASPAPKPSRPRVRFPDGAFAPEDLKDMDRVLDVDGEAYLRWLEGKGPDPCSESSD